MRNLLYVSTGTMVGKSNGYDYKRALFEINRLREADLCDGLELMMLVFYYDKAEDIVRAVKDSGIVPGVIHCEKEIGTMISDAGALVSKGQLREGDELFRKAVSLFKLNCEFGEQLEISKMVLHLWGGINSDSNIEYNISKLCELEKTAAEHGIHLLIENIPSNTFDPHSNWEKLISQNTSAGLIFDTRFGKLHEQSREILTDKDVTGKIEHVHISDFAGTYREFSALRPILHPGEGKIDFSEIFCLLKDLGYTGSVTLESPVMEDSELNIPKIENTLSYLRKNLSK